MSAVKPVYLDANQDLCQMLSGDFLDITQGGTGATTQVGAQTALGLLPGTNVEAWSASLDAVAALASTGLVVQTGAHTFTDVSLAVASTSRLTVTNPTGVAGSPTFDLATLSDSGAGSFLKITRDAYGRLSGTTAVVASDISTLVDSRYAQLSGGAGATFTGPVILAADPVTALGAATKQYVDNIAQGLQQKPTAWVATTAALPTNTYSNGSSGVGATLTATGNGVLTIDGVAVTLGMVVFVKNEATQANNGLYTCTTAGAVGAAYVLTRHVDMDQSAEFTGAFIVVDSAGTANGGSLWVCNNNGAVTVGTTAITFTQLNKGTDLAQGNGISISGNVVSVVTANSGRIVVSGSGVDLATSGVGAGGTYTKVTVDTYGRVTAGATATAADVGAQASSASLTALAALAGTGILVQTAASTFAERVLTQPAAGLTIANNDGVAGNPTFALANDPGAIEALNTNGMLARTGTDTWAARTISTASTGRITVTNGDGISGNPTLDLAAGVIGTPGTYNSVTVDTYGRVTGGTTVTSVSTLLQQALQNNQGSTINIGQAVYTDASGTVKLAKADASGTRLVTGLVLDTTIANTSTGNIAVEGVITATTTQWNAVTGGAGGLTAGAKYWLSNGTAGGITATAPTTGWLVYVGKALSTTQLELAIASPIRLT